MACCICGATITSAIDGQMARRESQLRARLGLPSGLIERSGIADIAVEGRREARQAAVYDKLRRQGARAEDEDSMIGASIAMVVLFGLLTLVSYVDRLYQEIGKFLSRDFQDNIDAFEQVVEPRLGVTRARASLSMAILPQLVMAAIAMIVGFTVFRDRAWTILGGAGGDAQPGARHYCFQPFASICILLAHQWALVGALDAGFARYSSTLILPVTLVLGFLQSVAALTREHAEAQPETPAEAVDALIEAGQEEGIIQEGDRDLIQSVVEFSGKTVREAMKPRPEMIAVSVRCDGGAGGGVAARQAVLAPSGV